MQFLDELSSCFTNFIVHSSYWYSLMQRAKVLVKTLSCFNSMLFLSCSCGINKYNECLLDIQFLGIMKHCSTFNIVSEEALFSTFLTKVSFYRADQNGTYLPLKSRYLLLPQYVSLTILHLVFTFRVFWRLLIFMSFICFCSFCSSGDTAVSKIGFVFRCQCVRVIWNSMLIGAHHFSFV